MAFRSNFKKQFLNLTSPQQDLADEWRLPAVWNPCEGRNLFGDDEIRQLSRCDGAGYVADTHGVSGIERAGIEGLDRGEAHLDAAEGHDGPHVAAWR